MSGQDLAAKSKSSARGKTRPTRAWSRWLVPSRISSRKQRAVRCLVRPCEGFLRALARRLRPSRRPIRATGEDKAAQHPKRRRRLRGIERA